MLIETKKKVKKIKKCVIRTGSVNGEKSVVFVFVGRWGAAGGMEEGGGMVWSENLNSISLAHRVH